MALPFGKLAILLGAGVFGSILVGEGRSTNISDFFSGALKIAWRQLKRDDTRSPVAKPRDESLLLNQVNSLRQELQMLASSNPITIVTASRSGTGKYGVLVTVIIIGSGFIWWKGWKIHDFMFATRRSLSDACASIATQLETVYSAIRSTRRELSSRIDTVDSSLNEVAEVTSSTQEKVVELRDDSRRIGDDVRYVRDAVETLEMKISRIEAKQDVTNMGVKRLCDYAYNLESTPITGSIQASASASHITFPTQGFQAGSLLLPASDQSSPTSSSGSSEEMHAAPQARQGSNWSGDGCSPNAPQGLSGESSGRTRPAFLVRTCSATNAVLKQMSSGRLQ